MGAEEVPDGPKTAPQEDAKASKSTCTLEGDMIQVHLYLKVVPRREGR